jgi:hypothetical protein
MHRVPKNESDQVRVFVFCFLCVCLEGAPSRGLSWRVMGDAAAR